jgi:exonuclease SbcC
VRPAKLEVLGLTSYKEPVSIDFTELDLFAITGPTGSGKSSLVDAITYALFGQAPRVGRGIKDLISQGSERVKVSLEFSADGGRYRVHRSSALKGQSPVQLEHFDEGEDEWKSLADKAKDVTEQIEHLLRMDYEAFIRSVLLPQGEFQEFLAGDRDQRRKVLDRLLQLGVYAVMLQRANALSAQERGEAEHIHHRLEQELSDATIEALATLQSDLAALDDEAATIGVRRTALESAARTAEELATASIRVQKEQREAEIAAAALEQARELLSGGERTIADVDAQIADIQAKAAETTYDADIHLKLTAAITHAKQRDDIDRKISGLAQEATGVRKDLERLQADAAAAKDGVTEARKTAQGKADAFDEIRRVNAAALLRQPLKAGDPCPVCGQAVGDLAPGTHGDLDRARTELQMAQEAEKKADRSLGDIEGKIKVLDERATSFERQLATLAAERAKHCEELKTAAGAPDVPTVEIQARVTALEQAREQSETLVQREQALVADRVKLSSEIISARVSVETLRKEIESHKREQATAEKEASGARSQISRLAREHGWDDALETLDAGGDVAAIVLQSLRQAQDREAAVNREIGACRTRIEHVKQNIALAEELRTKEKQHTDAARLARDLATLLRADGLPAFVRDSAMQALATAGSGWLRKVSMGRYDLRVSGQDFCIADLWNAGEERGVQTLSGGETFLASLALALALAEQLPGMSGDGDGAALESLFIDEGFSHLDEETLKTVRDALEVLGADKRRLIGVITHVNALAEALPARIVVHKDSTGGPSRVTIE